MEQELAAAILDHLRRRSLAPHAAAALAKAEGGRPDQVRQALLAARHALEAPVMDDGAVLDDATFDRLKRDAFGDEHNPLSRCERRVEIVAAVQQAVADAAESYAAGDVGGARRTYARTCERLLAEVLFTPDCGEVRALLEQALQASQRGGSEEESAWAIRRALDHLLELDARAIA
jgi:hypothetical protein